ncbi:MAG: ATP synthase F1 subunit delta [Bacteroidetes bacterium]|nr:ATP synthase F1 subunit delta [Bacteroidota bacterium]
MGTKVASRYAKALLDLAVEQKVLDNVNADMINLAEVCTDSKDLTAVLKSPVISPVKKVEILETVFAKNMNPMSMGFMKLIIKNTRAGILPEIADSFIDLYKRHNNIVDVYLTSAMPLDAGTKEKILQKVKLRYNGQLNVIEKIDPSLLGGFVVRIDDNQVDASIANQLTNLKNVLLN